jgi:hypothetical protein
VFYHDGIGTRGPLDHLTGGAFGSGMEQNIRNLYRFIVYNYEAVQAEPLARAGGMARRSGTGGYAHLAFFRPCFNSELKDSMTPLYWLMPTMTRSVGDSTAAGERVHQSVLDRLQLPACHCHPAMRTSLERLPVANTPRIARGQPCE